VKKETIPIGDNIRLVRNRLGYSQEYVADKLGISKQRYRQLENEDQESLTIGRIIEIAFILQTDVDTLINLHRISFSSSQFKGRDTDDQIHLLIEMVQSQKDLIYELYKNMTRE
jgi:transcriptional regulator with XRE-family HTH domain